MENVKGKAEEQLVVGVTNLMQSLAQQYDFGSANQVRQAYDEGTIRFAGANLVSMVVVELRQCRNFPTPHIAATVRHLRNTYRRFFVTPEFRQAVKLNGRIWALEEANRHGFDDLDSRSILFNSVEYLLNELMSPLGVEGGLPLFADNEIDEDSLLGVYRRLPQFLGLADYLDRKADVSISRLMSGALVTPEWYEGQDSYEDELDEDIALALYETIADKYPPLNLPHSIDVDDVLVKSLVITEYTGLTIADVPFRCLVATTTYHGAEGNDCYIALLSKSFSGSGLLIGEVDNPVGSHIVHKVYKAYAEAINQETGNSLDIEVLPEELENGDAWF